MENKIEKPTVVVIEETKTKLIEVITQSGLPAFIMEPILSDFLDETRAAAQREYETQKQEYERLLQEQTKEDKDKEVT